MTKIAILVSGGGTNLQAIIDNIRDNKLRNCSIEVVISNKKNAYALQRAVNNNIDSIFIDNKLFNSVKEYGCELIKEIDSRNINLVVLSGFNCILSKEFVENYKNRIINIHPSLIPAFCGKGFYGLRPHEKAIEYGVKLTGATVHFVDYEVDAGPIIIQKSIPVRDEDTPLDIQKRVLEEVEWEILPEAIRLFSEDRISVNGRRVIIKD